MSPNSSTADYLVPLTPLSNPTTPPPPDSVLTSPTSPTSDIPESQSTETILDDDEATDQREYPKIIRDSKGRHKSNSNASSGSGKASSSSSSSNKPRSSKLNGIDNGITLTPSNLNANINVTVNPSSSDMSRGNPSSKKSSSNYVGVETRKKPETRTVDEEIRC